MFTSCSQVHKDLTSPKNSSPQKMTSKDYAFPHTKQWKSEHAGYYATNGKDIAGTSKDCLRCHQNTNLQGTPLNVTCATQCHQTTINLPNTTEKKPTFVDDSKVCLTCHTKTTTHEHAHFPTAAGLCNNCHKITDPVHLTINNTKPSADEIKKAKASVTKESIKTCMTCHENKDKSASTDKNIHAHPIFKYFAEDSCIQCHNPHGSTERFFLNNKVTDLCLTCHGDKVIATYPDDDPPVSVTTHGIITKLDKYPKGCTNCHNPHYSSNEKMLSHKKEDLCISCHNKEIYTKDASGNDRIIPNMELKLKAEYPKIHSGFSKDCTACHNPHSTYNNYLIKDNDENNNNAKIQYPATPYALYKPEAYSLCTSCHKNFGDSPEIITDKDSKATNFRNETKNDKGEIQSKNLHWFHVVDATGDLDKNQGRSCFVCHDPHASTQDFHIKNSWKMKDGKEIKIEYIKTDSGGECTSTCHSAKKTYNRFD